MKHPSKWQEIHGVTTCMHTQAIPVRHDNAYVAGLNHLTIFSTIIMKQWHILPRILSGCMWMCGPARALNLCKEALPLWPLVGSNAVLVDTTTAVLHLEHCSGRRGKSHVKQEKCTWYIIIIHMYIHTYMEKVHAIWTIKCTRHYTAGTDNIHWRA